MRLLPYNLRKRIYKKSISLVVIFSLLLGLVGPLALITPSLAQAATAQEIILRLDRVKASTATTGTVCMKPATTITDTADVQVTFPTGFTVGAAATWTVTTTNLPLASTAWPSITGGSTGATVSAQLVTFDINPNATLTAGTLYCFNWSSTTALTNPTAANNLTGTIKTRNQAAVVIDQGTYAVSVVSQDQITLTATVSATLTLTYGFDDDGSGTDNFNSNLTTTGDAATSDGTTLTIATNAETGYVVWVKSLNAALLSAATGESITSPGTSNDVPEDLSGSEGYVLDTNATTDSGTGDGVLTIDAEFNGTNNGTSAGGKLSTTFDEIATCNGTTDGDVITLVAKAKASAIRAAGTDYTDTLTVVAAGRF